MNLTLTINDCFDEQVARLLCTDFERFKRAVMHGDLVSFVYELPIELRHALIAEIERQYPDLPGKSCNENPRIVAQTLLNTLRFAETL